MNVGGANVAQRFSIWRTNFELPPDREEYSWKQTRTEIEEKGIPRAQRVASPTPPRAVVYRGTSFHVGQIL